MLLTTYVYAKSLIMAQVSPYIKSERGQGLVEYGLIIALISVVAIAAMKTMGNNIGSLFNNTAANIHN